MALFVSALCAILIGFNGWRSLDERDLAIAQDNMDTSNFAKSLANHALVTLMLDDAVLAGLRTLIEADDLRAERLPLLSRTMAARISNDPSIQTIVLFDAAGTQNATSSPAQAAEEVGGTENSVLKYHRMHSGREAHFGNPFRSRRTGRWLVTVSHRIDKPNGSFNGVIVATLMVSIRQRFLDALNIRSQSDILLATTDGDVIERFPESAQATGRNIAIDPAFKDRLKLRQSIGFRFVSALDGVMRIGSTRQVDGCAMIVLVGHAISQVLADTERDAFVSSGITLTLVLALILSGFRYVRSVESQRKAERRYRLLAEHSNDAIVSVDITGRRLYVSPAFAIMTGRTMSEILPFHWGELAHPDDREAVDAAFVEMRSGTSQRTVCYRYIKPSGSILWVEALIRLVEASAGEDRHFVANIRDITERKKAEERIEALNQELFAQANTDGLTGLANRRCFDDLLSQEWRRAARESAPVSLLLIDVDRFKLYNDRYGHPRGDACLRDVARAICACARRPGDLAARYGGEELALLLPKTTAPDAAKFAERVRAAIEALAIEHAGNAPAGVVTASIGVATFSPLWEHAHNSGTIVATADAALYEAKRSGRNRVATPEMIPRETAPAPLATEADRLTTDQRYTVLEPRQVSTCLHLQPRSAASTDVIPSGSLIDAR